jgi:polar amino acid transport system substrate-binding protein
VDNLEDDYYAIGFRKDDLALRDKVNEILTQMAADGAVDEICQKWFGANISLINAG